MPASARACLTFALMLPLALCLQACRGSHLETPEMEGPPAMVDDAGKPRLWIVSKQEESRQVSVGGGSRSTASWRTDTFFHVSVVAYDPEMATQLWKSRILTLGDFEAKGRGPSRVIGSAVSARLLGQDGNAVWLLIGEAPYAVNVSDGKLLADAARIEELNPALKGLLPTEAKYFGFDRGLVLMTADARPFVLRGAGFKAEPYTAPPPRVAEPGRMKANGNTEIVPIRPFGEVPVRQAKLDGRWLGLYSQKEVDDLADDEWGKSFYYPYTVLDEGGLARRTFWHAKVVSVKNFDDTYERLTDLTPVANAPTFLKGRFLSDPRTEQPVMLENPSGVAVFHSTRMDDAGRLALTRLDSNLKTVWKAELPLSETSTINQVAHWRLPGHMVMVGMEQTEDAGVTSRTPQLVSVDLANGQVHSVPLNAD